MARREGGIMYGRLTRPELSTVAGGLDESCYHNLGCSSLVMRQAKPKRTERYLASGGNDLGLVRPLGSRADRTTDEGTKFIQFTRSFECRFRDKLSGYFIDKQENVIACLDSLHHRSPCHCGSTHWGDELEALRSERVRVLTLKHRGRLPHSFG